MQHKLYLSALVTVSLIGGSGAVFAQGAGAAAGAQIAPGMAGVPPVGTPPTTPGASTTTTGTGSGGINQPGVPNTSTPGIIGTGAAPSGLPGDSRRHPGFPGKVGR